MDKSLKFKEFREEYKEFCYNSYEITEDDENIYLEFEFEIIGLTKFKPTLRIAKKNMPFKSIDSVYVRNMVFNIGLIELISYWKSTCAPKVIIKCGYLNDEQINWWKKLYFYGLGELFYTNNIHTSIDEFMTIESTGDKTEFVYESIDIESDGYIVPIGGGKDSCVTLEILKVNKEKDYCLIVNPKPVTLKCAEIAGFEDDNIIEIYRTIDKRLLELNEKGCINGHTPFSTMLAFVTYLVAYLIGKKYVALSNENSANESNVVGEKVNHQYSKSFEFEQDFRAYAKKYLRAPVQYYSFLRPLNELQIAKLFSKMPQYHQVFKSCNVGSKRPDWQWCDNCAKCMFAFVVLSPYLEREKLVEIFHEDLYEKESMWEIFKELTGHGETKPFDCVGTFEEVNYAVSVVAKKLMDVSEKLPVLLKRYVDEYGLADLSKDLTREYNAENNLSAEQEQKLKEALGL